MKSDVEFDPSPQTVLFDSCKPGEAGSGVSHRRRRRHPHYPTALYKHKSSLLTRYRELVNIQLTYGRVYECHLWGIWGAISRSKRLFLTMQRERCFIEWGCNGCLVAQKRLNVWQGIGKMLFNLLAWWPSVGLHHAVSLPPFFFSLFGVRMMAVAGC